MKGHPWRSTHRHASGARGVKSRAQPEGRFFDGTTAYRFGGALHPLGQGKPYADVMEFFARLEGKLMGKWVGEDPPAAFIPALEEIGAL